jgi:hypothetical protein
MSKEACVSSQRKEGEGKRKKAYMSSQVTEEERKSKEPCMSYQVTEEEGKSGQDLICEVFPPRSFLECAMSSAGHFREGVLSSSCLSLFCRKRGITRNNFVCRQLSEQI